MATSVTSTAPPGLVAIIETPESFLAEARPNLPGQLAYSGKVQLFGGMLKSCLKMLFVVSCTKS